MQPTPRNAETAPRPTPQMQAVLDELAGLGGKPTETLSAPEARKQPTPADAVRSLLEKQGQSTAPMPVGNVKDIKIPGPAGDIAARVYTPAGTGPFPLLVYFHGGGWVIADLETYDASPRALVNAANCVVLSSHYRQGPEHPYPAAHDDAFAAYTWALANAAQLGADERRVALLGESAGGNLACAVSLRARDAGMPSALHQVLVYPIARHSLDSPSYKENAQAKPLNAPMMGWFFENYLTSKEAGKSPEISLVDADLAGLPPTTIITADIDPLRSDGEMLAGAFQRAGVPVQHRNFEGVTHEFFGMGAVVPESKEAVQFAATRLTEALRAS